MPNVVDTSIHGMPPLPSQRYVTVSRSKANPCSSAATYTLSSLITVVRSRNTSWEDPSGNNNVPYPSTSESLV